MTDQELAAEAAELRKQFAEWSGLGIEAGHLATVVMGGLRNGVERRDDLRAQLEAVTRERDAFRAQALELVTERNNEQADRLAAERERDEAKHHVSQVREGEAHLKRDLEVARIYAADREGLALQLDAARETIQYGIELRQKAVRERDEARESEARMRAALDDVYADLTVIRSSSHADAVDACAAHAVSVVEATLSAPAPEGPDYSGLCSAPECGGHCGFAHARGCEAIREYLAEHGGAPYRAPPRKPSARDMRVADAVWEACVETADGSDPVSRRVAEDLRSLDRRAIVAKVTP